MEEETILMDEGRTCPYSGKPCAESDCLAWIEEIDDCMFHVALTQVADEFRKAAEYLDQRLGLTPETGYKILSGIRQALKGGGAEADKGVVGAVLATMNKTGLMDMIKNVKVEDVVKFLGKLDGRMTFDLSALFPSTGEDEEE